MVSVNKVLAIQNYGSSGTLFVQSLLDGHPDILNLPALYLRDIFRFWEENAPFTSHSHLLDCFMHSPYYGYWFDADEARYQVLHDHGLTILGESCTENLAIDGPKFRELLQQELAQFTEVKPRDLLVSVCLAYARIKGRAIKEDMWILFPIHANPKRYAQMLVDNFAQVRFVHMIRNPVACTYSLIKHFREVNNTRVIPFKDAFTQMFLDIPHHAETPQTRAHGLEAYFPDNGDKVQSRAIRLEDLHAKPQKTLHALCNWLGLPWNDCLLASTFDGKLWNNRKGSIQQNGFGEAIVKQKYEQDSRPFDELRLRALARLHYEALGYAQVSPERNWLFYSLPLLLLIPFKAESGFIGNYIRTRMALYAAYRNNFRQPFKFVQSL